LRRSVATPKLEETVRMSRPKGTDGRWMTPDPVGGDITNPQSLNRYAYALDNPETLADPSGLWPRDPCPGPAAWGCDAVRHGVGGSLFQDPFSLIGIPVVAWGYGWIAVQGSGFPGPSFSGSVGAGEFSATSYLNVTAYWGPTSLGYAGDAFGLWGGAFTPPVPLESSPTRSNFSWWGTFAKSLFAWQNAKQAQKDAWNTGYYGCIGNEMFPFAGLASVGAAKLAEEGLVGAVEDNANAIAGAYYHFTDARFTAWGASSKVMVPRAAGTIRSVAGWVKVGGWALTDVELGHAIYSCSSELGKR
jgi:hypothetical protein